MQWMDDACMPLLHAGTCSSTCRTSLSATHTRCARWRPSRACWWSSCSTACSARAQQGRAGGPAAGGRRLRPHADCGLICACGSPDQADPHCRVQMRNGLQQSWRGMAWHDIAQPASTAWHWPCGVVRAHSSHEHRSLTWGASPRTALAMARLHSRIRWHFSAAAFRGEATLSSLWPRPLARGPAHASTDADAVRLHAQADIHFGPKPKLLLST